MKLLANFCLLHASTQFIIASSGLIFDTDFGFAENTLSLHTKMKTLNGNKTN